MIKSFFQSLSEQQVSYLLISGQATVLYGAATFSEDVDLWIEPTPENARRFLKALASEGGRYYKLTPPFELEFLLRGHGFHFFLPGEGDEETFLDVMGVPPRVPDFQKASRSAAWLEVDWGPVHTIGIKDLVELKKTQRVEDYPIISKLALAHLEQLDADSQADTFPWAFKNLFTLSALATFFKLYPQALNPLGDLPAEVKSFGQQAAAGQPPEPALEEASNQWMQARAAEHQKLDRQYWRDIIAELRTLRATGRLVEEGAPVSV